MPAVYAHPVVRKRLIEFLGGDTLGHATAVYITQSDGCRYDPQLLRRREIRHDSKGHPTVQLLHNRF